MSDHLDAWFAGFGWTSEALCRMGIAALLGGLVGIEREWRGRDAGFRTHLLVCLGAALAMIVSLSFAYKQWSGVPGDDVLQIDPGRIAYGVMAGIGFLGAGAIIQRPMSVHGLTTAASIWAVAAIGLAAGMGLYIIAFSAVLLVLFTLTTLNIADILIEQRQQRLLTVAANDHPSLINEFRHLLNEAGFTVRQLGVEKTTHDPPFRVSGRVLYQGAGELDRIRKLIDQNERFTFISLTESGEA